MHLSDAVIGTRCTETHAYGISHIDRTDKPPCRFVTADAIPAKAGSPPIREPQVNGSEPGDKREYVSPTFTSDLEPIQTLPNATEFSTTSGGEPQKLAQLNYSKELLKYSNKPLQKFRKEPIDQSGLVTREDTDMKYSSKVDHVYEEVNALECDIMDYYEKYSPTTAKTLINTLFLPRQKICKQCASSRDSPVYSDRLIYGKKALHAREIRLIQQDDALCFKYCPEDGEGGTTLFSQYDNIQHCLVVYNYTKTDASSIFPFYGPPRDVFDLKTALKPNILLVSCGAKDAANTELYHRCASNFYARISKSGVAPTAFRMDHNKILSSIKHVGYDTDLQNWMNYRNDVFRSQGLKQDDAIDYRANRSSLLLLEPLLLMPELTSPRYRQGKNRIARSEHMKLVKIVAAYTLSFFILASVTFYIVYFT